MLAAAILAATVLLTAGCGQKGPLYLPEKGAVVVKAPPAATQGQPPPAASPAASPPAPAPSPVPATPRRESKDQDQDSPPKP
jgi:predicted small lipoprotein YifL